jgi:excisionase family DNA binding protein
MGSVVELRTELLRADEVAEILGLGRSKVYEMMAAGVLPVVRLGRSVRVPRRQLYEWIDSQVERREAS